MAATLMPASQASMVPNSPAVRRFTPPSTTTMAKAITHWGTCGNQPMNMVAAPVISSPSTMISMNQYSHPTVNPAQRPMPAWA